MKRKQAKARQPKPKKARRAAAAALPSAALPSSDTAAPPSVPPLPPEPCGDDPLSIEAMLRAQIAATHVAAMDCLDRAGTAGTPEVRDQALTHATRLLSLFTRQVKTLEQRLWYAPAAGRGARPARDAAALDIVAPDVAAAAPDNVAAMGADDPADDPAGRASFAPGGGQTPARQTAAGGSP